MRRNSKQKLLVILVIILTIIISQKGIHRVLMWGGEVKMKQISHETLQKIVVFLCAFIALFFVLFTIEVVNKEKSFARLREEIGLMTHIDEVQGETIELIVERMNK